MKTSTIGPPSATYKNRSMSHTDIPPGRWRELYKIGGSAAMITFVLILIAIISHIVWTPPAWTPGTAIDWFIRFQDNWLLGLLGLDLMIVISLVLGVPLYLALYFALRRASESTMIIATAIAMLGTVLHLTSNTAFEMLSLSQGYAAAATDAQKTMFLAAGEAVLASYYGTAFHVSYILGYIAKIIIGGVMLRSIVFSKATAYMGILAGITGLAFYLPMIGLLFSIASVLLIAIWYVMIARGLFKLGQD